MPSVLIVEDHALFRSGLKQLIGIEPTVLVDAGHNPHGARALASALRPMRSRHCARRRSFIASNTPA